MSLRKYLKRKSYRERLQPSGRKNLGLLEKHKDYVERARHQHQQSEELDRLRREAEERNPNEFYFSMEHERTKGGVPINLERELTPEEEVAMKGKDLGFVHLRIRQETKNVERLKGGLHLLGCQTNNSHIVFIDDEKEALKFDEAQFFQTPRELLDRTFNRPRREQMERLLMTSEEQDADAIEARDADIAQRYEELNEKMQTLETLKALEHELWLKRELAKGGEYKKIKLQNGSTAIKWKKIRK